MNRSLKLRRACAVGLLSLSAGVGISPRQAVAQSTWSQSAAGTHDYFNAGNWDVLPAGTASEVINFGNVITGDQTVNLNAATTLGVLNLDAATANFTLAAGTGGTLTLNNGGTAQINVTGATAYTISAPVTLANPVAVTHNGTGALTMSGIVSGAGGFTKDGTGRLTLNGVNTYTGINTVTAGALRGTVAAAFGASTAANGISLGGGTLELANNAATNFGRNVTVTATSTIASDRTTAGAGVAHTLGTLSIGAQTLNVTRGSLATSGTGSVVLGATTLTGAATFAPAANAQLTLGLVSGAFALNKTGDGNLILASANTYTGATTINAGTLTVGAAAPSAAAGALGNAATAVLLGDTSGTANASLVSSGAFTIARAIDVRAGSTGIATIGGTGGNASVFSGTITLNKSASLTAVTNGTATFSGVISGVGSLTKVGAGTVVLSNANTFTGATTTIDAGALQINNAAGLSNSVVSIGNASTGRLAVNAGVTLPVANSITIGTGVVGTANVGLITTSGTGRGTINGGITINALPTNGGVFGSASTTVGNELVVNGAITGGSPGIGMSQAGGRVAYVGAGSITGTFNVAAGTALVGATNGIPTGLNMTLGGGNANATLDLSSEGTGGFNQSIGTLGVGSAVVANNFSGNVVLGARTLTVNGDLSVLSNAAHTSINTVTATTGAIDFGVTPRNINVADTASANELVVTGTNILGAGPITKAGTGMLVLRNSTVLNNLNVAAGGISPSNSTTTESGTLNAGSLTFAAGTSLRMKIGAGGDVVNGGVVSAVNPLGTTINLLQLGVAVTPGVYNLINYTGTTPGTAGFTLALPGRVAGGLIDTGTAIAVNVTGNDTVTWTGGTNGVWDINTTANWKLTSAPGAVTYLEGDELIFDDSGTNTTITGAATVNPTKLTFTNTIAKPYTIELGTTIAGGASLNKTGDGVVTLRNVNTFSGAVTVGAGTLELDHDATGNVVLTAASGVSVAGGATLRLTRDDGDITFSRNLSGAGTVVIDPHTAAGAAVRTVTISGTNTGFSGLWRLAPSNVGAAGLGSFRTPNGSTNPTTLGTAAIEVANGGQLWMGNNTYTNNITISGTGYAETAGGTPDALTGFTYGGIGALRIDNGSTLAGTLTLNGNAKIQSFGGTATISGVVGTTNPADLLVIGGGSSGTTIVLTGTNNLGANPLRAVFINSGGTGGTQALRIGAGGTTGTLGTGNVTLNGSAASNALIAFDRSDGYTLAQTITAINTMTTTFVDVDTLGTGLSTNGNAITLGTAAVGGSVRIGQTRAGGSILNADAAITASNILVGANQLGTANLNNGAVVNANSVRVALGNVASTGSVLNINNGASLTSITSLNVGELAGSGGTINQAAGSTVSVGEQVRVGHFGTNTSVYNMSGGSLTLTGASPTLTPSTAGAGGASATGDNNINALATPAIVGGGIYIGIDGQGIFNHTGGTVTTNWIVLDNRGNSGAGANMADGIDRYSISGGAVLNLRSTYGLIARNTSTDVSFGGGTIRVDNTGTGTGTGANINIPLDATITTVAATTTVLDTQGAGNAFTLTRDVTGSGTLNLTGGGTINLATAGQQTISASLTGSNPLTKTLAGTTTLTGNLAGFNGPIAVNAGRLNLPNGAGTPAAVTLAAGATIGGEPTSLASLALNGSAVFFDPNTPGALTTGTLNVAGTNLIGLTATPTGAGPWTVINYSTKTGVGTFAAANPGSFRVAPTVTDTGSAITLDITGTKALTWSGAASGVWDINTAVNWTDTTPAADVFFNADSVTFAEGGSNPAITITGLVGPSAIAVNAATTAYTITSATGNQIVGTTGLTKTGAGTLTLVGPNLHTGQTSVGGGVLAIAAPTSLGDGSATNNIAISGTGRLSVTAAMDLGVNRGVAVGTGGGSISYNNAAAGTVTLSGNLTGAAGNTLTVHSAAAGGGTFALTGNNAAYAGNIIVDAQSTGLTTLQIATNAAAPGSGSITVNYPAAGISGNANTINLPGTTLPAGVTLNMTSLNSGGTVSLRTQITSSGIAAINGPITLAGDSIVQVNSGSGVLTLNGNVTASGPFTGTFFLRGAGNGVVNGTVNIPAGNFAKTDAAVWTINSTGNNWATTSIVSSGGVRLGVSDAFPAAAPLNIGQGSDANNSLFDMNGFNQTVNGLTWTPGNGNSTRGVGNATANLSILTINSAANNTFGAITGTTGGIITGNIAVVKQGTGVQTFGGANTYTGATDVQAGTLQLTGTLNPLTTLNLGSATGPTSGKFLLGGATAVNQTVAALTTTGAGTSNAVVGGNAAVSTLTVNNAAANTFAGTLGGTGTNENSLALTKTGIGTLNLTGTNTYTGSTTVTGGALVATTTLESSVAPMSITGAGSSLTALRIAPSSLTIGVGASAKLTNIDYVGSFAGRSTAGTLANTGLLDVNTTGIVIASAVEADVRAQIISGRNAGVWTGTTGITSSAAIADPANRAVGYNVSGATITVAQTIPGDSNLDGIVNVLDRGTYLANVGQSPRNWQQADWNYDDIVNVLDRAIYLGHVGMSLPTPPPFGAGGGSAGDALGAMSGSGSGTPMLDGPVGGNTTPGDGVPAVTYDPTTGKLMLDTDGLSNINAIFLPVSPQSRFVTVVGDIDGAAGANWSQFYAGGQNWESALFTPAGNLTMGTWELATMQTGLSTSVFSGGIQFILQNGNLVNTTVEVVPEPTGLALAAMAGLGLLARRRRRA